MSSRESGFPASSTYSLPSASVNFTEKSAGAATEFLFASVQDQPALAGSFSAASTSFMDVPEARVKVPLTPLLVVME